MQLKLRIKNYKLILDTEVEFQSGFLYYVHGGNERGKTSFMQSIKTMLKAENTNKDILTKGAEEGSVEMILEDFQDKEGNKYKIEFTFDKDGKETFKLITPDTNIVRKVTEIRSIFKFNDWTVDEFLSWGLSAEGRRKQAAVLTGFLSDEQRAELNTIEGKIKENKGSLFIQRRDKTNEYERLKILVEAGKLSEDEKSTIAKQAGVEKRLADLNTEHDLLVMTKQKQSDTLKMELSLQKFINDFTDDDEIIASFDNVKKAIKSRLHLTNDQPTTLEAFNEQINVLKERIEKGSDIRRNIEQLIKKQKDALEAQKILQTVFDEKTKLDVDIDKLRKQKSDIIKNASGNEKLIIIDDELKYKINDTDYIPFTESSVSYSVAGLIVADMLMRLNTETKISVIGKASEYSKPALDQLAEMAKQNNAIIFADYVDFNDKDLTITVYEG